MLKKETSLVQLKNEKIKKVKKVKKVKISKKC